MIAVGPVTLSNEFRLEYGKVRAEIAHGSIDRVIAGPNAGDFDLIALGRALLANPEWVIKVSEGRSSGLRPFSRDPLDRLA